MDCSTRGFPVFHYLLELAQTHVHWASDAIQPSYPLSCLLLLPLIFPSIRVFSNESALHIRWPKYWSFSFSISLKRAEHWRIDTFEMWFCRRLLRVPWITRRSNQSILKEINPEYSLEGLMLKLKLQCFGHLIRRADHWRRHSCWKDLGQEDKKATVDEMVG